MRALLLTLALFMIVLPAQAKTYDKDYFGETVIHKAAFEDTLIHLARGNGLGYVELRTANPTLDSWIPGAGARIVLPMQHILPEAPREGLVINLAEMRLYYFKTPGEAPQTYPISIGREGLQTPVGSTTIVRKAEGPTWRPTPRMREEKPELPEVVLPGPDNPLGTHALYLGWPQYLIHGTNKPYGVGRRVSSGCMRMYPEDIIDLFPQVPVGTRVTVVDQPVKAGWIEDKLYVEVSPTQDQSLNIEMDEVDTARPYEITSEDMKRITKKAGVHADKIDWALVRKAVQEHRGYPVAVLSVDGRPTSSADVENDVAVETADIAIEQPKEIKDAKTEKIQEVKDESKKPDEVKETKTSVNFNLNQ